MHALNSQTPIDTQDACMHHKRKLIYGQNAIAALAVQTGTHPRLQSTMEFESPAIIMENGGRDRAPSNEATA